MVNLLKIRRARSLHSLAQAGPITGVIEAMEQVLSLVEKARSFHSHKTLATDVGKARHQKTQDCKALDVVCRGCGKKGHFEKVCLKAEHVPHIHLKFHKLPPVLQGLVNLYILMTKDSQYLPIWSVHYI